MDDLEIQIKAVTERSLNALKEKALKDGDPDRKFDLILRNFASFLYINLCDILITKGLKKTSEDFVFEKFCLDTPNLQKNLSRIKGNRKLYEKTVSFLEELRFVPLVDELSEMVNYDDLIPWIRDKNRIGHDEFFKNIQDKHPHVFSYFDEPTTIAELTCVLMAAIERRYRSDTINKYIKIKTGIEANIEDKLTAVLDWQINKSQDWFDNMKKRIPELPLTGFQRVTVVEIVPLGLDNDYFGDVGGKTIKVCTSFDDLNREFTWSQGTALGTSVGYEKNQRRLGNLRDLLLPLVVDRRYIFPGALNDIILFYERTTNENLEESRDKQNIRSMLYKVFSKHSNTLFGKMYPLYDLASR